MAWQTVTGEQIRRYRLIAHHLCGDAVVGLTEAAASGLQNSPPGAWETALFNRVEGCALAALQNALYREKTLLQAWSWRGVPAIFPTAESDVFLSALAAMPGESWIYTQGVGLALDHLGMDFDQLLPAVCRAAKSLDGCTVKSKEALDRVLAEEAEAFLPPDKLALWRGPSMYDRTGKQTVGGAVVSFLLRPCSFLGLVVFGERDGISPTFTSYSRWTGHPLEARPDAARELVRKFLHFYGPATPAALTAWLGCSPQQTARLWKTAEPEMCRVQVGAAKRYMLAEDLPLLCRETPPSGLRLLGAHDPYLDLRDREVILENKTLQRRVWRTVANPGAVLEDGRVVGIWKSKTDRDRLEIRAELWESLPGSRVRQIQDWAERYAGFRQLRLHRCEVCGLV